ncbi:MAG: rod shape-determining protein [Kurthia gibsonii]|uniref:Cell shape-determining protein MreB n=1 Tax=Kurthia gibsonii TaxID=33946 RepID=A0ABU9LI42_9BACL|nr:MULTISPECIES: rod shape-determining protein MreB [Kurthia]MCA9725526.1 rod shape-determining protein MreB [Kurthia sp.]AMA62804.1 cell shape determining, MreB/Mrl family protein [Kurthia sp. 11kri321]MEB6112955.1 rod shape-determining protein MreB [Kurthia gibsonii]MEB7772015.1 rod shape-determining protein MreB [Kurthia gibsonii]RXH50978.1 MreB/Mrl family cell shape determining protein [Kurthia gibsonii]
MFSKDVGIDLGTANVLIYLKGKGVILNEPSVVAIDRNTKKVLAVGEEARQMIGRTPENIVAIRPLKDGVIHDFDITEAMLKYFIQKLKLRGFMSKPRVLVCCPSNITPVEQKAIRDAVVRAGGGEVYLEEEPKVAAIGAGMDIFQPSGNMVIDIGGGTTDVAVLSMGEVVTAQSLRVAGDQFDQDIAAYIKKKYKLLVGERTAESLKMSIGSMILADKNDTMDIRGRDMVTGLPKVISFTSEELLEAISDSIEMIIKAAKNVLEKTPPELSADIIDRGIMLTGGGALISGLDRRLTEELLVPVYVAENPMDCVVLGTGMILDNLNNISKK